MARKKLGREKRKKGKHTAEEMRRAISKHLSGASIRTAAKEYNIPYPTLRRYVLKYKNDPNCSLIPNYEINTIFTLEQENELKNYVIECAQKFYGISAKEVRRIAYQMGKINNIQMPPTWNTNEMAGKEWFRFFKQRHPELAIRKPEPCSLARATAFNKVNVQKFFNNLKVALQRHESFADGSRIYNLDETATTTVQRPQKIVTRKGTSACKVTSGERGTLVTTCLIINALGQALPPVMVFPRKNFQTHMLNGAPSGTLGLATASGWMNTTLFVDVIKHFVKHTSASMDNPALLIMDNHESHLSIEALDIAKSSGVTVLTLHPHTTAKLQPLDVGVNAPFKTFYNAAIDSWMMRHPGKLVTIYHVAECVGQAFLKALTPVNIVNAFKKCGIHPYDDSIFTDIDFLPSVVTDRPEVQEVSENNLPSDVTERPEVQEVSDAETDAGDSERGSPSILIPRSQELAASQDFQVIMEPSDNIVESNTRDSQAQPIVPGIDEHSSKVAGAENRPNTPSTPRQQNKAESSTSTGAFISPSVFRPPLKADPRKGNRKRTQGRSMIATDTPEKQAICEKKALRAKKQKRAKKAKQDLFKETKRRKKNVEKPMSSDTSEDEPEEFFQASGSSSGGDEFVSDQEEEEIVLDEDFRPLPRDPQVGDYVIVLFVQKKVKVYFVAKILEEVADDSDADFYVSYLKLKSKVVQKFCGPLEPDLAGVRRADIKYILPKPTIQGTSRRQVTFQFAVDLSNLNFRY